MSVFKMPSWTGEEYFERFAGPAALLLWNGTDLQLLRATREYYEELGTDCTADESNALFENVDSPQKKEYLLAVERAVQTGEEQECVSARRNFSQLCGYCEIHVQTRLRLLCPSEDGYILLARVRNVTAEKQQEATDESERRFRYAAEQANMYAWEYTVATKQMRPCYRCMRDLGLPALLENYPEPAIEAGIFPQDYADMYRDWHRQIAAGTPHLESIIPLTPQRVPFHVRYTTVFDDAGNPVKAYGSATAVISGEHEQEYKDIIHCLGKVFFGLYYFNLKTGEYTALRKPDSKHTEEVIAASGYARDAFAAMLEHLVAPEYAETVSCFTDFATLPQRLADRDVLALHFKGTHFWCEGIFIVANRNERGDCTHAIWGIRSIQQQKEREEKDRLALEAAFHQTEKALEEARRANAAKTAFLSRMSHDIRTPLNGIIGLLEINDRHPKDTELLQANRAKGKVAANHLLALISDVLELSKMDDINVHLSEEAIDVCRLAKEIATIADLRAAESGIIVHHTDHACFAETPYIFGSPLHIKQVMLNIIGNAIKYNRPGGSVTCSASAKREGDKVLYTVTVADTGIGMSPEFLKHLYEPFSQERSDARSVYKGTGLGMAIVKSLVEKMNGTVLVESTPGAGTTFTVTLPLRVAQSTDISEEKPLQTADVEGARVLVVEDNTLNMEIIVSLLEEHGVLVTQAVNGQEAVDIYASNPPYSFDLILMDLMMPVLDGYGATEAIRAMDKPYCDVPIWAMTANAFSDDVRTCLKRGMNGHMSKPVDIAQVLSVITEYRNKI